MYFFARVNNTYYKTRSEFPTPIELLTLFVALVKGTTPPAGACPTKPIISLIQLVLTLKFNSTFTCGGAHSLLWKNGIIKVKTKLIFVHYTD